MLTFPLHRMTLTMTTTTLPRRTALGLLIAATLFASASALAATPTVEIIAFAHSPVVSALKPLREWLATQGNKIKLQETDMESPAGVQRLQAVGVKGHVPIVIVVNGKYQHKRADGSPVELISFPGAKTWTMEDAKAVVTQATNH